MGHSIGRTALVQLQSLLQGFLQDGAFPFSSVLTVKDIVDLISQTCVETCDRIFTPLVTVEDNTSRADIDEYSDLHIGFHQAIIVLSTSQWLATMTESLVIHMCAMRARTIGANDRAQRSIIDHMHMMTA